MYSLDRVNIPLLDKLIPSGVKPGTVLLVEFDPESQWFSLATTITAGFLAARRHVAYNCMVRSTADVKDALSALGVNVGEAIRTDLLDLDDFYSATLSGGRLGDTGTSGGAERTEEGVRYRSLKIQDLSVEFLKSSRLASQGSLIFNPWPPGSLSLVESISTFARFNEEKPLVEWLESRKFPEVRRMKRILIDGVSRGVHSDWFYERIEGFSDGAVEIQLRENEEQIKNFLRVRSLKGQPHDSRWHAIEIKPNGEATLAS